MTETEKELEKEIEKQFGIGKTKVGLVICAVLVVILAISSVWLYTRSVSLQNQIDTLKIDKNNLQSQVNNLDSEYDNYVVTHQYTDEEVEDYADEVENLIDEMEDYVANHHFTDEQYYKATFSYYYIGPEEQKFGVYNLSDELDGLEWIEPYQEGMFDCSEMSAYLEWYLENEGWHTIIVVGDAPFDSGYHAWLLVETSLDHYMPVESTNIEVVWWSDPYFDNYFIYDYEFETIQEAMVCNESEFDWWK